MLKITYLDIQECVQAFIAQSPSEPPPCETTVYPNLTWPDLTKLWQVITMPPFEISNLSNIPKKSSFNSVQKCMCWLSRQVDGFAVKMDFKDHSPRQ